MVSGSGPIPLCLHHAICHAAQCDHRMVAAEQNAVASERDHVGNQACNHSHHQCDSVRDLKPLKSGEMVDSHDHECGVCFWLGQFGSPSAILLVSSEFKPLFNLLPDVRSQQSRQLTAGYLSRGPPAALNA